MNFLDEFLLYNDDFTVEEFEGSYLNNFFENEEEEVNNNEKSDNEIR